MISALARLNVDPWEEAATLAQLPLDAAMRKLTLLIAALPAGSSARSDPAATASRLLTLLQSEPQLRSRAQGMRGSWKRFNIVAVAICFLSAMGFMVTSHSIIAARSTQPSRGQSVGPVTVTVFRQAMLPHYDTAASDGLAP
jgi:hypothetical protein